MTVVVKSWWHKSSPLQLKQNSSYSLLFRLHMASPNSPRWKEFCFTPGALQDFLRASRSTYDDPLSQSLNALIQPSSHKFDPTTFANLRSQARTSSRGRLDSNTCSSFQSQILFPGWMSRETALMECEKVAANPDLDDPNASLREAETQKRLAEVVDERLDPYSGRFFPTESRAEVLARIVHQERGIERIVRDRSWDVLKVKCEGVTQSWEVAMESWRRRKSS